ncbi:hypothetical protein VA249_02970 [Vibrio alfacsensis]|nr:hypothetical protein VA249_02970 [Vibrio alfacsensis]
MVVPWVNKEIIVEHLKQISAVTERVVTEWSLWMVQAGTQMTLHKHSIISVSSNSPPTHQS